MSRSGIQGGASSPSRRNQQPLGRALGGYIELMRDRRLLGYAGTGGFFYGGIFAYIAGTPFAYIRYYDVSPKPMACCSASASSASW